jgi:hypothetical protein
METERKQTVATAAEQPRAVVETPAKNRLWPPMGVGPHLAVVFILGAIVLFTYANTLQDTEFALDNKFIILEDPRLRQPSRENLRLIFQQDYWWPKAVSGLYRPLTTLSYMFNYSVLGNRDRATGYHWVNFLLHWANTLLVYCVVLVLMEKLWPALFTAALFGTHPIATESVTNIVGRADLFATMSVLGGLLLYAKSATVAGWRRVPWLVGLGLVTLLGVFCKEGAVAILGVLVLYDFTYRLQPRHPNWWVNLVQNFWRFACTGYVALAPAFLTLAVVRSRVFAALRPPELPWVDNPIVLVARYVGEQPLNLSLSGQLTAIKVIGKYFWLLLWPQRLSCDYSYNQIPLVSLRFNTWEDWKALIALAAMVAVLVVAIRNWRRNKPLFFFIMFFFVTLFPVSNLFRIIGSIMAERFMYLPSIGFAGCVMLTVYALCRRVIPHLDISTWAQRIWLQVVARTTLSLIVVVYGARSFVRNFDWENDVKLWSQAVKVCPNSFKTHKSLAYALYEKDPEGKNIDRIIEEGEKAMAVTDKTQIVLLHLGAYYRIKGDTLAQRGPDGSLIITPESRLWYEKSVAVLSRAVPLDREFNEDNRRKELRRGKRPEQIQDIGNHEIYWNLGLSHMRLSQYQEALDAYLYMRHLAPTNADAYLSIASVFLSVGRVEEAAVSLLQALLLDSSRQEALRLLVDIYRQIDREGCAVVFTQGQPRLNADCTIVRNHICSAYFDLIQVFLQAKQRDLALHTKRNALQNYPCPADAFEQLLPEPPTPAPPKS